MPSHPAPARASQDRSRRSQGPRVNLTLPPDLDALLGRLGDLAGTGKASFVRQWLVQMQPQLVEMVRALEMAQAGNLDALTVMAKAVRGAVAQGEQAELQLTKVRRAARRKQREQGK